MSLSKINNFANDDTDILAVQTTVDALYQNSYSLTEYDSTTVPAIAAGSKIEVNGSLYRASSEEAISTTDPVTSAAVADGTIYICMIPSGDASTCTAAFTATAPTWSDSKQGWYGTGDQANYKYLNCIITKATAAYSKHRITPTGFPRFFNLINGTLALATLTGAPTLTMTYDLLSEKTSGTEITVDYSGVYRIFGQALISWTNTTNAYKYGYIRINKNGAFLYDANTTRIDTTAYPGQFAITTEYMTFLSAGDVISFYISLSGASTGSTSGYFSLTMI